MWTYNGQTAPYRLSSGPNRSGGGGGLLTSYAWACGPPIEMKIVSSLRLEVIFDGVADHPPGNKSQEARVSISSMI
jgi:hypothetical protein